LCEVYKIKKNLTSYLFACRQLEKFLSIHVATELICDRPAAPKVCPADPKGSANISQWICGHISVMANLKLT